MRVNWTNRAVKQLDEIASYIEQDDPEAAERVATFIFGQIESLASMSERGKPGKIAGTREMFFSPWPYFAVYRIVKDEVRILRIRHAARRWPVRG